MQVTHYRIVFDGELEPGMLAETVKANLAKLFKSDLQKIEQLFGQGPVNIKRDLSEAEADKYLRALQAAGAKVRKEPEVNRTPALTLVEYEDEPGDVPQMDCPKCGHSQAKSNQCSNCGIVIEKYLARQAQAAAAAKQAADIHQPYAPPRASVGEDLPEYGELKPFSVQGRIGRLRYLAWSCVMSMAGIVLILIAASTMSISGFIGVPLITLVVIGLMVVGVQIGVQRLHDIGWSGWLMLLMLVPVVGSIFPIVLMLGPGTSGANRFGPPPPPNTLSVKILALACLVLPVIGIIAALVFSLPLGALE